MRNNRLQLNLVKIEESGNLPSLILDVVTLSQRDPVHNLEVLLDS